MLYVKRFTPLTGEGRGGEERRDEGPVMHKEGRREWNRGGAQGPVAKESRLYLDICAGNPQVPSYATADGANLPT